MQPIDYASANARLKTQTDSETNFFQNKTETFFETQKFETDTEALFSTKIFETETFFEIKIFKTNVDTLKKWEKY